MTGGKAFVTANDDGVNATATSSRVTDGEINISGGYLDVTVPGSNDVDGIDSNGTYTQTGGTVIVRGPANGGAWSLDTDSDVNLEGGTLIVVGGIEARESGGSSNPWYSPVRAGGHGGGGQNPPGGGGGGGMPSGGSLIVDSKMTKSTSSTGLSKGTFQVTFVSGEPVTYTNVNTYSGSVIIYSVNGTATVTRL